MRLRVGVLSGAGVGALLAALWLAVPEDRIARLAAGELQRLTGRDFVAGDMGVRLWPAPGVVLYDVAVDGPGGALARAERVVLTVGAGALFGGEVAITGVDVSGLHLVAGRDGSGRSLWTLARGAEGGAVSSGLMLRSLTLRDGSVDWADARTGEAVLITGIAGRMSPDKVEGEAVVNGQTVHLMARAEDAAALWTGGSPVQGEMAAGDVRVLFAGRAGLAPLFADGQVTADGADLAALAALARAPVPAIPAGLGRDVRQLAGRVTLAPQGSWHLRDGVLTLDGNRLDVAADLTFDSARPKLAMQVSGEALDIVLGGALGGALDGSETPVAVHRLLTAGDAEVALRIGAVTLNGRPMGPLRAEARVERARAQLDLREVGLFGGRLTGEAVVNARGGLSVAGKLTAAGVDLAGLAAFIGWGDRLAGRMDARLSFEAAGDSAAAMLAGLDGAGRIGIGQARLAGTDLAALFAHADAARAAGDTAVDLALADFRVTDGVVTVPEARIEAADVALSGSATLGLASQTLDLRLVPVRLDAGGPLVGGPLVPLRVKGTWAAPELIFDLSVLAETALAEDRARAATPQPQPVGIVPLSGMR